MAGTSYDVVIAGGGPAGATTALRLARTGFSVLVLDAARFPRFKPCGEFMSPECLPRLAGLGVLDEVRALGAREVRGMLLHSGGMRACGSFVDVGRAIAPSGHGFAVRRDRLDDLLRRAALRAGAGFHEGARVLGLLRAPDGRVAGVRVREESGEERAIHARFTVGADGARSTIATELGLRRAIPWLDKVALTTRFSGVPWGDRAEVHLFEGGFLAAAPVDGGLVSVNLVLERARWRSGRRPREEVFAEWLDRLPAIGERLRAGSRVDPIRGTGAFACTTVAPAVPGAALVGDACGYVDPVTGEGIFFALAGAELLAASLDLALRDPRRERAALAAYRAGRRREIEPRAAFALLLQRGLRRPRFVRAAWSLLAARPAFADLLVSLTGDYVPLRELLRPGVWMKALRRPRSGPRAAARPFASNAASSWSTSTRTSRASAATRPPA